MCMRGHALHIACEHKTLHGFPMQTYWGANTDTCTDAEPIT